MKFPIGKKLSNILTNVRKFLGVAESKHAVFQMVFKFYSEFVVSFSIIVGWVVCQKKKTLSKYH